jgi:hypothetical protein
MWRIMDMVEMPDRMAENLQMFHSQEQRQTGKEAARNPALTDEEVPALEAIVREAFDGV